MPPKDIETRDATLYIMNEDGTKTELGPVASVDTTVDATVDEPAVPIEKLGDGEVTFEATMDLSGWQNFIRRYMWCNNYRKMLGVPMKRRKQLTKARINRYHSFLRRMFGSVKYGNYVWSMIEDGTINRFSIPIVKED